MTATTKARKPPESVAQALSDMPDMPFKWAVQVYFALDHRPRTYSELERLTGMGLEYVKVACDILSKKGAVTKEDVVHQGRYTIIEKVK